MTDEQFFQRVRKTNTCWIWIGKMRLTYGVAYWRGKTMAAHRVSVFMSGREIPEGMCVDHICRVRTCVNPDHLRVVTHRQNTIDFGTGPAAINARKTHCVHGHPLFGENVKWRKQGKYRECYVCARAHLARWRRKQGMKPHSESRAAIARVLDVKELEGK